MTENQKVSEKTEKNTSAEDEKTSVETANSSENTTVESVEEKPEKIKGEPVQQLDEENFLIGDRQYRLVKNYRDGYELEKIGERYSEVLARYDYIVGDWGYEQLRLKGFFRVDNRRAHPEQRIDSLEDYLYEYCNFGCAYFVIERISEYKEKTVNKRKKRNTRPAHVDEKKIPVSAKKQKPVFKKRQQTGENETKGKQANDNLKPKNKKNKQAVQKPGFTIRKREE